MEKLTSKEATVIVAMLELKKQNLIELIADEFIDESIKPKSREFLELFNSIIKKVDPIRYDVPRNGLRAVK